MSQNKVNEYKVAFNKYFDEYKRLADNYGLPIPRPSEFRQKYPKLQELYKQAYKLHIQIFNLPPQTW